MNTNKPTIEFKNTNNVGDNISALVSHYTGNILGEYMLEQALDQVRANNKKIDAYKQSLLCSEQEQAEHNLEALGRKNAGFNKARGGL